MALYCRLCGGKIKSMDRKYKHGHFKKLCIRCYQEQLLKGKVEGDNWVFLVQTITGEKPKKT